VTARFARPLLAVALVGPVTFGAVSVVAGPVATAATAACTGEFAGLTLVSGSGQVGKVGTAFADPFEVNAIDTGGCPMSGISVDFVAPVSGASGLFSGSSNTVTVVSGSDGNATAPIFTANNVSGSYQVYAQVGNGSTVYFDLTNTTLGVASGVLITGGDHQSVTTGGTFSPLEVSVTDAYGDAVPQASVQFSIVAANGASASFVGGGTAATVTANQSGVASSPALTAGTATGAFTVTATVTGSTAVATFDLDVAAGVPDTITAGVGTSQEAVLGTDFPIPLAVTVDDADGNAVAGVTVTFSAPASGAGGVFVGQGATAEVTTNSDGVATAPNFSANQRSGGYVVMASVSGLSSPATFAMVNEPRRTASVPGLKGSYWLVTGKGRVLASGHDATHGSVARGKPSSPVVAMAASPGGSGYWLATRKGAVYAFGAAARYPATGTARPGGKPIVAMAATADGKGYWLVASNGAVFSYGDAVDYGSPAAGALAKPIVAMATTADGKGYWLVSSDGAVFSYGDAHYYGRGHAAAAKPIVAMATTADGKGYWLVSSTGVVSGLGDATVLGSAAGLSPKPVVGIVATADGAGYWVLSANGTAAGFGDAGAQGTPLTKDVVGGAA
jgi:hypothetical protein